MLLDGRNTWTDAPSHELARLRPRFFLTMHCQINDAALKKILDASTIDDINHVNGRVDDPFSHPNYDPREHFDNSLIEESIALLEDRLSWQGDTRLHTVTTGASSAIAYGLGCHAVADFYSHSNYGPMALAYYGKPADVLPIDQAIRDAAFLTFVETKWDNRGLWQDHAGYSTTQPFPLGRSSRNASSPARTARIPGRYDRASLTIMTSPSTSPTPRLFRRRRSCPASIRSLFPACGNSSMTCATDSRSPTCAL